MCEKCDAARQAALDAVGGEMDDPNKLAWIASVEIDEGNPVYQFQVVSKEETLATVIVCFHVAEAKSKHHMALALQAVGESFQEIFHQAISTHSESMGEEIAKNRKAGLN
jgi:hypothetical protein